MFWLYFLKIIKSWFNGHAFFLTQDVCHCNLFMLHITSTFIFTAVCVNINKLSNSLVRLKFLTVECVQDGIPLYF